MNKNNKHGYYYINNNGINNGEAIVCVEVPKGIISAELIESTTHPNRYKIKVIYKEGIADIQDFTIRKPVELLGILSHMNDEELSNRIHNEKEIMEELDRDTMTIKIPHQDGTSHLDSINNDIIILKGDFSDQIRKPSNSKLYN